MTDKSIVWKVPYVKGVRGGRKKVMKHPLQKEKRTKALFNIPLNYRNAEVSNKNTFKIKCGINIC